MHVEHPADPTAVAGDRLHSLGVPYMPVLQAAPEQLLQLESHPPLQPVSQLVSQPWSQLLQPPQPINPLQSQASLQSPLQLS